MDMAKTTTAAGTRTTKISAALPAATLAQRLASMSLADLMTAARALAQNTDQASDQACTAVLREIEKRALGAGFDRFVSEIFA